MLHASKQLTPSPKLFKPQTLQTSNPSNLKPFKPQTLQTLQTPNSFCSGLIPLWEILH